LAPFPGFENIKGFPDVSKLDPKGGKLVYFKSDPTDLDIFG
jgi:hypothetical protein